MHHLRYAETLLRSGSSPRFALGSFFAPCNGLPGLLLANYFCSIGADFARHFGRIRLNNFGVEMAYFQIKHHCLSCGEFFIICTEFPEDYTANDTFCPKCSIRGSCISAQETIPGSINDIVFSESLITGVGEFVEVFDVAGGVASFRLRIGENRGVMASVQHTMPYRP